MDIENTIKTWMKWERSGRSKIKVIWRENI